jgi:biotin carboxyl carrier protein
MKLEIELGAHTHSVELPRPDFSSGRQNLDCTIDGKVVAADAAEIGYGIYSILIDGRSVEVHIEKVRDSMRISVGGRDYVATVRDPRKWQRNHRAASASEGRQSIAAPMPGRVVRVLVKAGESVQAGQGIAVVEAMKMQNEVRSPKGGKVDRLAVSEGQTVNAGDTIAVIG